MVNLQYVSNLTPFASILTYICMCGSGSKKLLNTDPDPQHCTKISWWDMSPISHFLYRYLDKVRYAWARYVFASHK